MVGISENQGQEVIGGNVSYRFASGILAERRENMVYIDFIQVDPHIPQPQTVRGVARIVVQADLVDTLIDELSALRAAE